MRSVLKLAEAVAPSILWIDEIEKGFGSSGSGDSGTSQRVFGTFLTWMQEKTKPVFVIATANKIDGLPPEFLRKGRFDEIFFVDLPTPAELKSIWRLQLEQRLSGSSKAAGRIDLNDLLLERLAAASNGFSGAEVAEAVVSACFDAYSSQRPLEEEDLFRSIQNTVPLSKTQEDQIRQIREWAENRAVAATSKKDAASLVGVGSGIGQDVASYRGGRQLE
jgi:SpoVK/Ycf46/Vps4 family AAA+-type ATPase